jgi:integrase
MPMMGRHGAGSIVKRKHGPPYHATLIVGGRRLFRYAQTVKEAERALTELRRMRDNDLDPTRQTVADFLRSWMAGLRDAKRQRVRPRTLEHYELIVERHIIPGLGKHRLSALREAHVQSWLDADASAPRTIHHHRAVLRRALNVAVQRRLIDRNPAVGVELPDASYTGAKPLTMQEAQALLQGTVDDRLHALWRMAIDTGLRQSELLGLGWDDIDLDAGVVRVTSQLQRIKGQWARTPTKSSRSLEAVNISEDTVAALREHQRRMAAERTPEWVYYGLVFPSAKGQPLVNHTVLREWHEACDKAGIERRRFHDLRHSAATLMRELDVPEDTRMARFGHNTTAMARRYGHASAVQDRAAADALGRALRR